MSRSITPIASQAPVAPGTHVVIPAYTDTGFSAGDYVYTFANNSVGFPRSASMSLPTTGSLVCSVPAQNTQSTTGPQTCYGPLGPPQAVYTGSTITAGTVVGGPTVLESVATSSNCCVTGLVGGNIAIAWQNGSSGVIKYAVYAADGVTVVKAAATATSDLYTSNPSLVTIAAMANGNFYIMYVSSSAGNQRHLRYNSVGTNIDGPTNWGSAIYSSGYAIAASFAGGVGFSNYTGSGYYGILNNGAGQTYFSTGPTGPSGNGTKGVMMGLVGTNSNTMYIYSIANSTLHVNWQSRYISSGGSISSGTFTPSAGGSQTYGFSGCALANGNFMVVYFNSSSVMTAYIYSTGGTGGGTPTLIYSYSLAAAGFGISNDIVAVATASGFMVFSVDGSTNLNYALGTATSGGAYSVTFGNLGLANSATQSYGITGNSMANGNVAIGYLNASSYPTLATVSSQTLTNGTTLLSGTGSFAAPSYVLLGVAASTASAGSTGSVIINGPATLNTNYPSVATPIAFDYTGQGVFGNKGTVAGRAVNLRGLE